MTGSPFSQAQSCLVRKSALRLFCQIGSRSTSQSLLHDSSNPCRTICTASLSGNRSSNAQSQSQRPSTLASSCRPQETRRTFTQTPVRKQDTPSTQLTWNEFLKLRKTRRNISLVSSIGTAVGSTAIAVPIMAQYEVENQIAALTGLDPFIGIGLTITAVGGIGWLLGPFVGNTAFGIWKSSLKGEIARVSLASATTTASGLTSCAEGEGFLWTHQALPR